MKIISVVLIAVLILWVATLGVVIRKGETYYSGQIIPSPGEQLVCDLLGQGNEYGVPFLFFYHRQSRPFQLFFEYMNEQPYEEVVINSIHMIGDDKKELILTNDSFPQVLKASRRDKFYVVMYKSATKLDIPLERVKRLNIIVALDLKTGSNIKMVSYKAMLKADSYYKVTTGWGDLKF